MNAAKRYRATTDFFAPWPAGLTNWRQSLHYNIGTPVHRPIAVARGSTTLHAKQLDATSMNKPVSPKSLETKETRDRDSLFLLAEITFDGSTEIHKVKVRNLSPGGMMIESDLEVVEGQTITANLRNVGAVRGQIAWARTSRFGVAFDREINPKLARQPVGGATEIPRYLRTVINTKPSFYR